jgi:nucleotide-binding universal stress UspA family protein
METVIVGIEPSGGASDALALARRLAEPSARLVLVCAYPIDPIVAGDGGRAYARALLHNAEATLARASDSTSIETVAVADPHPWRALARAAAERCAALVVIGSTHTGRLRRVMPGSTGERLLSTSRCQVAIAPHGYARHATQPALVTCAYDGTVDARRALAFAAHFAHQLGTRLLVMRVMNAPGAVEATLATEPAAAAALRRTYDQAARSTREVVAELDPSLHAEAIVVRGDKVDEPRRAMSPTDLLVVGSRGYGPLRGAVSGSLSGRLIRYVRGPLLLVPPTVRAPVESSSLTSLATDASTAGLRPSPAVKLPPSTA